MLFGKVWLQLFSNQLWVNSKEKWVLQPSYSNFSSIRKTLNSNPSSSSWKLNLRHILFVRKYNIYTHTMLSWNFSDWFTVGEGDELLVSTLLSLPITRTTPSVLLVLGRTIFYFRMRFNHNRTGKTMSHRFSNKPKMKTTRNAQFKIQIILLSPPPQIKTCMRSNIVLVTKIKMFIFQQFENYSPRIFLVMICAKIFLMCFTCGRNGVSKK